MLENNHYRQNLSHMDNSLYYLFINTNRTSFIFNKKLHSNHISNKQISNKTYLFMFQKKMDTFENKSGLNVCSTK